MNDPSECEGFSHVQRDGALASSPAGPARVLAAEPANPQNLLVTKAGASLPFGGEDAAEPAGETPALRPRTPQNEKRLRQSSFVLIH
jgi:hypothetical protein